MRVSSFVVTRRFSSQQRLDMAFLTNCDFKLSLWRFAIVRGQYFPWQRSVTLHALKFAKDPHHNASCIRLGPGETRRT